VDIDLVPGSELGILREPNVRFVADRPKDIDRANGAEQ
jgi:hypothetical protein